MTIEQAIVAKLGGDATLTALAPGGVWLDVAPSHVDPPYVIVSLQAHSDVEAMPSARAYEDAEILAKAVSDSTAAATALGAADRIDTLLQGGSLTITDGTLMAMTRSMRVRYVEIAGDERWQHAGGVYNVTVSR